MIDRDIPEIRRGEAITASWLNRVRDAAMRALRLSVEPPLELIWTGSGYLLRLVWRPRKWLRVTGGSNPYSWQEVTFGPLGSWLNGLATGTTLVDPLYEANNNTSIAVGTVLLCRRAFGTGTWIGQMGPCAANPSSPAVTPTPTSPVTSNAIRPPKSRPTRAMLPARFGPPSGIPWGVIGSTSGTHAGG